MMRVNNITRGLPAEYQEVEWIGSSRTQVINTGVIPTTQTYTAELEVESTQSGSEYWAFGIWGTTGFRGGQDSSGHWDTSFGGSYEPSSYNLNTKTKITMSNSGKGTSTDTAIGLFGMGENGAYSNNRKGAYKIYYCKIWNSGTLIRDFVPCYRKSDSVIGMYDLVNNQFYTNSGTGTFTKGADIPDMVEKQVRPSGGGGWQPGANTVLYCPLKDDILDHSGNHTMTMTTSTYGTVAKDSTGFYYFNGGYISSESYSGPITAGTLSTWVKKSSSKSGGDSRSTWSVSAHYSGSSPFHCGLAFNYGGYGGQNGEFHAGTTSGTSGKSISGPTMGSWELWTMTYDNTVGAKFYRNGVYEDSFSNTNNLRNDSLPTFIGATNPYTDQYLDGYLSDVIIEDKARTAQEVTDYYNLTKSNYGL